MPRGDGTGPDGNGPKRVNKGWPEPRRDGSGRGRGMSGDRKRIGTRDRSGTRKRSGGVR